MVLDLKDLFAGKVKNIFDNYQLEMSIDEFEKSFLSISPITINYNIKNQADVITLKALVYFSFTHSCDRCTKTVEVKENYEFNHILVNNNECDEDDEYISLNDFKLDLDNLIKEDILLKIPAKILCSEDCKGLCPKCGKDLNEGPCDCPNDNIDPRLEALRDLLN